MTVEEFITYYSDNGFEKQEISKFWISLVKLLFGREDAETLFEFEKSVAEYGGKGYIDAYMPGVRVLIEQKSSHIDLTRAAEQSDGSLMTPYEQARRYASYLGVDEMPKWIITCNFREILIYNQNQRTLPPEKIMLSELVQPKAVSRLAILINPDAVIIGKQEEISREACEKVRLLYDALEKQYKKQYEKGFDEDLNALCIRLVFLFYAEDDLLLGDITMGKFDEFVRSCSTPANVRRGLISLFDTLNQKTEERDPFNTDLNKFPYVNGGLFADKSLRIPEFDADIVRIIEHDCGLLFDWSGISPTIFGALFESVLNPETRRKGGMHYTAPENINKAIAPLFLDGLYEEFEGIKKIPNNSQRDEKLRMFQERIASLTFLDPACGSGNFLTETYISLRKLENEILAITGDKEIKVGIANFYGIEINSFAATVAKTAMWIAESQMLKETEAVTKAKYEFFPLKSFANIVHGNALELEWDTLRAVPNLLGDHLVDNGLGAEPRVYDYIIGNPPFVGARLMSEEQKKDLIKVLGKKWKNVGNLDFVSAWYKKSVDLVYGRKTRCALVSTNSIVQGEQVANLWKPLFEKKLQIDFAYRTFKWDSESNDVAHVHCVIIGFHCGEPSEKKYIIDSEKNKTEMGNINAYLLDAPNVFVGSMAMPICNVPRIGAGNMPNDAKGALSNYSEEEKNKLVRLYPDVAPYIKRILGSEEFINNKKRYCLWFKDADITAIKKHKKIREAISKVEKARRSSDREETRKLASTPYLFGEIRQPESDYLIVPSTSSERRKYIPMAFLSKEVIITDAAMFIAGAELWHFAVLTSNVHMAWMRTVAGRLKSDYRYSGSIVYNNFVWVELSEKDKKKLAQTAQAILDARAKYPNASFAEMYDPLFMPVELLKAHKANDRLVMKLYGFDAKATEEEIVGRLMEMYAEKMG